MNKEASKKKTSRNRTVIISIITAAILIVLAFTLTDNSGEHNELPGKDYSTEIEQEA